MGATLIRKPATLREQIVEVLLDELRSGKFGPGERLTEQGLAERLDVSRTPIREALNQLMEQGLLHARPRGGYVVPSPTVEEVRQVIAVRMLLEPPAVSMAAELYGAAAAERMTAAIEATEAAVASASPADFVRANEGYRAAIFGGLPNPHLRHAISQFANHLSLIRATTLQDASLRREAVERQRGIRDAMAVQDAARAEAMWREYLALSGERMITALSDRAEA